jgi:two-component system nitrate/nitrite response regulator NarL
MPNTSHAADRRIRLCVVDDHALFREGLIRLLAGDPRFEVVFHTGTPAEAMELLSHHTVDVLILDYDLGGQTAVSFVEQLKAYSFAGRILIVTAGLPDSDAVELIRLGISGIFHKQDSPEDLQTSIHQVALGRVLIDQKYLQNLVTASSSPEEATPRFTERERSILRSLLQGLANKEIAAQLRVSESAVKSSLQLLFNKLGVRTRSQLVLIAIEKYRNQL